MSKKDQKEQKQLPETNVKNRVDMKSVLVANLDQVVAAKVGRLQLKLNNATTVLTNQISSLRTAIAAEEKSVAAWAKKEFVDSSLLAKVPAELGLQLAFGPVTVSLKEHESTAQWSLQTKNPSRHDSSLAYYSKEIPTEQTAKYFSLVAELATAELNMVAVRRELGQLESKATVLRGMAAEAQLKSQGLEDLIDSFGADESGMLELPANIAALLSPVEKVVSQA